MNFDFDSTDSYWLEPDFLLLELVSLLANKSGAEMGVTLMIKGVFLTGTLVGERVYLELISDLFKDMLQNTMPPGMTQQHPLIKAVIDVFDFTSLTEDVYPDEIDEDDDDPYDTPPIRYLHLRDPMMIQAGAVLNFGDNPLPIMRIRLSAVDGWMAGRLMTLDEDAPNDGDGDGANGMPFDRMNRIQ